MALDPYSLCPAGTGKKLKFCCSDLIGELEKIQRMVEGEQRLAALEYIEKLLPRFPGRACLVTTQAELLMGLNRMDEAKRVLDSLLQTAPANPVGLAESAMLVMQQGNVIESIDLLQQAISVSPTPLPMGVVEVISAAAEGLVTLGYVPAAIRHLLLAATLMPQDQRTLSLLVQLNASLQVPLLFKEEPDLPPAPADAAWGAAYDEAVAPARRGAWRAAADKLATLSRHVPAAAAIWHSLASLRTALADNRGAVEALRQLAALNVDLDDRVEAEALAQLLDPDAATDRIEMLSIEYPISNIEELALKLADPRLVPSPIDPRAWAENNEAPPRFIYALLDRETPASGAGLAADQVPNVLAQVLVFGRQTDREARLEITCARPNLETARAGLNTLCGALLGPPGAEIKRGEVLASQWSLSWNWRLPENTPIADVHRLLVAQRRHAVLSRWTATASAALGGKTPQEAAGDEGLRVPLLASVLLLELSFQEPSVADLFNELRRELSLPEQAVIDPKGIVPEELPLARLHRVNWSAATDDQLLAANRRALFAAANLAVRKISIEILSRDSLKGRIPIAQVYGLLARLEDDSQQALDYLEKARAASEAAGESSVMWKLQELTLRLERGEPDEFSRMLEHIQRKHGREPGVAQALAQILVEAGLMTPDGRMVRPPTEEPSSLVLPESAGDAGKIWTPEGESGTGKKSALWVPGAE